MAPVHLGRLVWDRRRLRWCVLGALVKLAFADPPYLGCCGLYDHFHGDDGRCWDELATHEALLCRLEDEFDGWAYCMTSQSLSSIAPLVPSARVAAWVKPFAAYKANVRIAYTWEPVLFVPGRDRSKEGAPVGRDHLAEPITLKKGLTGAKPVAFCRWVLDLMGFIEGDELADLFSGTGVMARVAAGDYRKDIVPGEMDLFSEVPA